MEYDTCITKGQSMALRMTGSPIAKALELLGWYIKPPK